MKREKIRRFFTEIAFNFTDAFYKNHEIIFCTIINQTNAKFDCWRTENVIDTQVVVFAETVMKDVFGSKANKKNIKVFFNNNAIGAMWWPQAADGKQIADHHHLYITDKDFKAMVQSYSVARRTRLTKYFSVTKTQYAIFP